MVKMLQGQCHICGNVSGYDEQGLKGSTWRINGNTIILCCPCEDELLKKLAFGRGIDIKYGDGGEIHTVIIADKSVNVR